MKIGDRVRARVDMKIVQADGVVLKISCGDDEPGMLLVEWDMEIGGKQIREIPSAWCEVIPAIDRLADLA